MLNKLNELIIDRNGKLSPYKVAWQICFYLMIYAIITQSIKNGSLAAIPENWISLLVTVSGAQLGKSYLANKETQTPPAPKV